MLIASHSWKTTIVKEGEIMQRILFFIMTFFMVVLSAPVESNAKEVKVVGEKYMRVAKGEDNVSVFIKGTCCNAILLYNIGKLSFFEVAETCNIVVTNNAEPTVNVGSEIVVAEPINPAKLIAENERRLAEDEQRLTEEERQVIESARHVRVDRSFYLQCIYQRCIIEELERLQGIMTDDLSDKLREAEEDNRGALERLLDSDDPSDDE